MGAFTEIVQSQLAWAQHRGLKPNPEAYLPTVIENLFKPLSAATEKDFRHGAGGELEDRGAKPAKMRALYSSSALVCNVFDYWRNADVGSIARSLSIAQPISDIRFEAQIPSGLRGTPPTLDMLLVASDKLAFGVESKFTEPYYQEHNKREPFAETYFNVEVGLWTKLGMPNCQELAARLDRGAINFEYLDAAQLLKHTLGVRRQFADGQLILLWFNTETSEAEGLSNDIRRFSESVDPTLGFRAVTYQEIFVRLKQETLSDPGHVEYLRSRYFAG